MGGAIGFFGGAFSYGRWYLGDWFYPAALVILLILFFAFVTLLRGIMKKIFCQSIIFLCFSIMAGCSLPSGTREITAWGVGILPINGIPFPFAGYWHSTHGDREGENSAKPPSPFGASKP